MYNDDVLENILKIEAQASALVKDAQAEADRRIIEAEKINRIHYDESYQKEAEKLENELIDLKNKIKQQYQEELKAYKEKISNLCVNRENFFSLLNELIAGDTQ